MMPRLSVLMPIYNAATTLPFALTSLQAQTFEDWECVVVDDGSTDNPGQVVEASRDKRIRFIRLGSNYGRGYARQVTLDEARGEYITMLDADDWIYPEKFSTQLAILNDAPELAIVSTGIVVTDAAGSLVGVRKPATGASAVYGYMSSIGMPPFAFAPSMMNARLAKQTGFDSELRRSQDVDFLLRAVLGRKYGIISTPLYVYRENATLAKVISSLDYCCRMFRKHSRHYPLESAAQIAKVRAKQAVYYCGAVLGFSERLVLRRSQPADPADIERYEQLRKSLQERARSWSLVKQ